MAFLSWNIFVINWLTQGAGREEFGSVGMPCNVEGSAMTLLPNTSTCMIDGGQNIDSLKNGPLEYLSFWKMLCWPGEKVQGEGLGFLDFVK